MRGVYIVIPDVLREGALMSAVSMALLFLM